MATPTYTLIDSTTLTSSASSVTFSSITQDYRDLVLVAEYTPTGASAVGARLQINGDTGSNYNFVRMIVDSAGTISSASNTNQTFLQPSFTSQVKSLTTVHVLDYSATDKHKPLLIKSGNTNTTGSFTTFLNYQSGRWANTSAVTSVSLFTSADQFAAGSTFYLYGIAA